MIMGVTDQSALAGSHGVETQSQSQHAQEAPAPREPALSLLSLQVSSLSSS